MTTPHSDQTVRMASTSQSSLAKTTSVRSMRAAPSSLKVVITAPPWARDEPPTPVDAPGPSASVQSIHPRPSQSGTSSHGDTASSTQLPYGQQEQPLWWMFTRKGREEGPPRLRSTPTKSNWPLLSTRFEKGAGLDKPERPFRERAKSTWLGATHRSKNSDERIEGDPDPSDGDRLNKWSLHIPLPTPAPLTLAHNRTPGWESPWTPRDRHDHTHPFSSITGQLADDEPTNLEDGRANGYDEKDDGRQRSKWYHRRKKLRMFILNNAYVPLLFRVINITFTSAALGVAVNIRRTEMKFGVLGAVGSSPMLVIIFAPLTLVHVMAAIYLEYFGRPLGLWRTSGKVIHTLSETVFICAWSAALSLCFDNFFTSLIPCAPAKSISWYSQIPRPTTPSIDNLGRGEGQPGDKICDDQIALIALVFVGLIMYCTNLFISLFRIFEKVKYHTASSISHR